MKKASEAQIKFIVDLGLMRKEKAEKLSFIEAKKLLNEATQKFYIEKLLEWGAEKNVVFLKGRQLKNEYQRYRDIRLAEKLRKRFDKIFVGDKVFFKLWNSDAQKQQEVLCEVTAKRPPRNFKSFAEGIELSLTILLPNGKKRAVSVKNVRLSSHDK